MGPKTGPKREVFDFQNWAKNGNPKNDPQNDLQSLLQEPPEAKMMPKWYQNCIKIVIKFEKKTT